MLFNSLDFAVFLPLVFGLYWAAQRFGTRAQNALVLAASYTFYGWWDARFLGLIAASTLVDYLVGLRLGRERRPPRRRALLWSSLTFNLGLLAVFKYYDWFVDSFAGAFSLFGVEVAGRGLDLVLPVGISFYTFQTLSYSIDVYRGRLAPTRDPVAFAAFVAFFPQLVAGPIERATQLLPQFLRPRRFDAAAATDGLRQILWGLFKKVVVADNCARYVALIFDGYADYSAATLALGAVLFAFQIYGDFSGYSDVAIGTARLFGFDLKQNFRYPYFARDIAEFWRRWHVSLTTWFRDYLYVPLGGSRGGKAATIRNVVIVFLVSGLWHGANWTFVAWGALHAAYFVPLLLLGGNRRHLDAVAPGRVLPQGRDLARIAATFALTTVAWVFFRAEDLGHALGYLSGMLTTAPFAGAHFPGRPGGLIAFGWIGLLLVVEWVGRERAFALEGLDLRLAPAVRYGAYYALTAAVLWFGGEEQAFIYFQF